MIISLLHSKSFFKFYKIHDMEFLTLIEVLILVVFTFLTLRRFAAKQVNLGIKVLVYFAWFLSFSVVILVPLDV